MSDFVVHWYGFLSALGRALNEPVRSLADAVGFAPLTALLLGFIGALSPCQLTTGLGALALIGRRAEPRVFLAGLAYVSGKAVVYVLLGLLFVLLGEAAARGSIPLIQVARKALGPLMLVVGLALLGVLRPSLSFGLGERVAAYAGDHLDATRPYGAFLLGLAFGLAFCPTLFLLFFVLLVPLALASPGGAVFPALFAVGTTLPLLAVLGALAVGLAGARGATALVDRAEPFLTRLAGAVLVLTGANDTIVYWFL